VIKLYGHRRFTAVSSGSYFLRARHLKPGAGKVATSAFLFLHFLKKGRGRYSVDGVVACELDAIVAKGRDKREKREAPTEVRSEPLETYGWSFVDNQSEKSDEQRPSKAFPKERRKKKHGRG